MDDPLRLRFREVGLGHRGYPVEGPRDIQELHAVSGVRQAELAYHLPEDAEHLSGRHTQADVPRQKSELTAPRPNKRLHATRDPQDVINLNLAGR